MFEFLEERFLSFYRLGGERGIINTKFIINNV